MDDRRKIRVNEIDQGWSWIDLEVKNWDDPEVRQLNNDYPFAAEWLDMLPKVESNYLSVRFPDGREPIIFGSLLYSVVEEIKDGTSDCEMMHFFVGENALITINLDANTCRVMEQQDHRAMLYSCSRPIDGLFVLTRTILHYFHSGMDRFEQKLRRVEETMKKRNHKHLMDRILSARFELLYWSNLFIPFMELITAAREAYLDKMDDSVPFKRFSYRAERMRGLVKHYEKEIDTLISIDDAVSAFRGNDIMKTLTIMTAIFTPATVIGAIWGMNFNFLPWVKQGIFGFLLISGLTLFTTVGFYVWIKAKGWTGDLLEVEEEDSNL
ncbi:MULTISPECIES: magnesium transporter CorA family protein [Paenibacillus]|uniref:Magnesium transporter n=1 Tax=Paenibacillus vini TaxID=1476024 RepID=A0ABQ4MF33_9BACL|nr:MULTISPECIES: magnesium transporter CorA family protein [Paenibacillus]MBQ4901969.1 magnesium transporter CorA family protein [Paenibacillus sp. Marseille-P2973]MDN4068115.1 magnesium transporter CorA family protein [Paenibacillus vini]GIP54606.1 magnesium transporter [Paenibacillus vini]